MISNRYDSMMQEAMRRYLPCWDWRWQKAQLYQESQLDPNAHSPAGAMGIAQFMKPTWDDMLASVPGLPSHATPWEPQFAIPSAAWYVWKIRSWWRTDRPEEDRRRLAFASYNAGFGNMSKAQQLAGGARDYHLVIARLPDVTGEANARQTTTYVERIEHWFEQIVAADGDKPAGSAGACN